MTLLQEAGPQPYGPDFPTQAAYLLAWYTWRAIRHDGCLTDAERAAQWVVTEETVLRRRA